MATNHTIRILGRLDPLRNQTCQRFACDAHASAAVSYRDRVNGTERVMHQLLCLEHGRAFRKRHRLGRFKRAHAKSPRTQRTKENGLDTKDTKNTK